MGGVNSIGCGGDDEATVPELVDAFADIGTQLRNLPAPESCCE